VFASLGKSRGCPNQSEATYRPVSEALLPWVSFLDITPSSPDNTHKRRMCCFGQLGSCFRHWG